MGNDVLCPGDRIRVDRRSRVAILLPNETLLRLAESSALTFAKRITEERSWLDLLKGAVHFISRTPRSLKISTPFVNAGVEGTEFALRVESNQTSIWVFEGQVAATNAQGTLLLYSGEAAVAEQGNAPARKLVVRPRDAVQWALYYPPVIDFREEIYTAGLDALALREALVKYRQGDLYAAFARLDSVPSTLRTARYYELMAGLLLSVGQVDEARATIEQALALNSNNGIAYALQSVIAVTQNDNAKALTLAQQGAELSPQSPVPQIALSYAQQALFDIEKARQRIVEAVNLAPQDALAWARLAELELSLGYLDRAVAAARKAVDLNPYIARTQTVFGFSKLIEIKIGEAKAAFESAIDFDPADPLPRLGLGLAIIRQGDIDAGTKQIETAAILDPDNALIRSYLGKAYYEQKRTELARTEFAIAKELDAKDPTPWFYDAILKQTENQPVEALHDLQRSIELNDNRAVYRSRLLLDQDLAARSTSMARIYDDLGFDQVARVQATKSVSIDPANHSVHRFLSDTNAKFSRQEIARVSELLQSQLLQPININPVQPSLVESDLSTLTGSGPAVAGFNEFTSLFARDGLRLSSFGLGGNNDTYALENVLSGIYRRVSYSLGQFHYETDGFRKNNDVEHDVYNLFVQAALTNRINVQFEYRDRQTDQGDIRLNFDPNNFSADEDRSLDQETPRVGLHLELGPNTDFIVSGIYSERKTKLKTTPQSGINISNRIKQDGYDVQSLLLFRRDSYNLVLGGGIYEIDQDTRQVLDIEIPPFPPFVSLTSNNIIIKQNNAYLYTNIKFPENLIWTLGLSVDSFDDETTDVDRVNPKLGLQWKITDSLLIRGAFFETLKRELIVNQTLEPTQIAGFNQFFDDFNGTKAKVYGIGFDGTLTKNLYTGVDASRRDLELPEEDQAQELYRFYTYWTPSKNVALRFQPQYEETTSDITTPKKLETTIVPLTVQYSNSSGFFAKLGTTYVRQKLDLEPTATFDKDNDDFFVFDASINYRLPKRYGIIGFEIRNMFDKNFLYQDNNFINSDPFNSIPRFIPERTFYGRIKLNF